MDENWLAIKKVVDEQAEDEAIWFDAETAAEAFLQQKLRKLHAVIEQRLEIVAC